MKYTLIIEREVEGKGSAIGFLHSIAMQINKGFTHGEGWKLEADDELDAPVVAGNPVMYQFTEDYKDRKQGEIIDEDDAKAQYPEGLPENGGSLLYKVDTTDKPEVTVTGNENTQDEPEEAETVRTIEPGTKTPEDAKNEASEVENDDKGGKNRKPWWNK